MSYDPQWPNGSPYAAFGGVGGQPPVGPAGPVGPATPAGQSGVPSGAAPQQGEQVEARPPAAIPMVDIVESADELVVRLDAPGFEEDQIEIHADANNLFVTADRSQQPGFDPERGERALLSERPMRLERTISLPAHIDPEQATATHENGVCKIVVQKDDEDRRHEIGFQ
ncbi:Hsp20/alpha crystallin family protein [Halobacterium litoreum]|uniref:Hsp20/alpha crystallin family protein n=1 Tax=Halobacterium litoreum TaxID=2039234 RepID=A0ABD5ND47_9EURY|nr:Hsp20/alpha crystallin family protein [Halobacterium litoreum]UHH13868.1 Hsp20/alpha crystallin family protein [Halobacterium litoreum]